MRIQLKALLRYALSGALVVMMACLVGCDVGPDDASSGCCGNSTNMDLTVYEDDVRAIVEHTFSGTIEDGDHDVPCRFDGQPFELYLQLASLMSCEDSEYNPADCTNAAHGSWELEGEIEVDAVYHLTGHTALFENCDLSVLLTTDLPCYQNGIGDGLMDCLFFEEEISQFNWDIQNDEEAGEYESCMLNVESME